MITEMNQTSAGERQMGPLLSGPLLGEVSPHDAFIWVRARSTAPLTLHLYRPGAAAIQMQKTPAPADWYCLVFHVTGLEPGATYEYDLSSQHGVTPRYPLQPGLSPSARRVRIAFGSCNQVWNTPTLPIFDSIGREKADVFVMNGDTSYFHEKAVNGHDGWESEDTMMEVHLRHRNNASLRKLVPNVSTLGIWDDHDYYGPDDSDGTICSTAKDISLQAFKRMWAQRKYGLPEVGIPGVFSAVRYGPVEIFLTDGRYHRKERNHILGNAQLAWLKTALQQSTAAVKLVVSGSVVLPEFVLTIANTTWEGWRRDAYGELADLLTHIETQDIQGVIFASGDLHLGYLMHRAGTALPDGKVGPEYWEISASPLTTAPWTDDHVFITDTPTYDPWLVKEVFDYNYGLIDIDLDRAGHEIVLHLKNIHGHDHPDTVRNVALNDLRLRPRQDKLIALKWPTNSKAYFFKGDRYARYECNPAHEGVDPGYPKLLKDSWPGLWANGIDAAIEWNNGKVYLFKGAEYIRYDVATDQADPGFPKLIKDGWNGLWTDGIDAAVMWNNGKAYFFKGAEYIRYDVATDLSDPGYPMRIADGWPGLWADGIDAAIMWNNGKAYFFKGKFYIRYDVAADRADGAPMRIAEHWHGLERWPSGVEAAVMWNNSKAYFFNGGQYMRYDVTADQVDAGYPQPILRDWPELLWKLPAGLDTAVAWPNGKIYFFSGNGYLAYSVSDDRVLPGYPKYIALNWGNWPEDWAEGIDAGLVWDTHTAYFFKGAEYVRYNIDQDCVETDYPKPIKGNWPGLAEAFPTGVDSAMDWGNGFVYFFKGDQYVKYRKDPQHEGVEPGYPYPIQGKWPGLEQLT